jgi:hypothetical protein
VGGTRPILGRAMSGVSGAYAWRGSGQYRGLVVPTRVSGRVGGWCFTAPFDAPLPAPVLECEMARLGCLGCLWMLGGHGVEIGGAPLESAEDRGALAPPTPRLPKSRAPPDPVALGRSQGPCSGVARRGTLEAVGEGSSNLPSRVAQPEVEDRGLTVVVTSGAPLVIRAWRRVGTETRRGSDRPPVPLLRVARPLLALQGAGQFR